MAPPPTEFRHRAVSVWLIAVAALIFAMVLVGGATRLTESGLSITEWKPVTGTLPPLSQAEWQAEFAKYRTIPQYRELNAGMSLDDFKTIYWWEWTHRFLGRLIGAAFLLPFLWFLWRGWIAPPLRRTLWGIFALGAVQGAVGWWMVASGLAGRTSVSQYRLAFHLTLAAVIYAAIVWTVARMHERPPSVLPARMRSTAVASLALVGLQIYLGALVAGVDAGLAYNTWPLIDEALVPASERLFFLEPAWRNFFENGLMVQFQHRLAAYVLWLIAVWHVVDVLRAGERGPALAGALALVVTVTLQAAVGIVTLLLQVPLGWALLHQAMALIVLTIAVVHLERLMPRAVVGSAAQPGVLLGRGNIR
jgi:cytochrome c oxidase assembly protein subunit 15